MNSRPKAFSETSRWPAAPGVTFFSCVAMAYFLGAMVLRAARRAALTEGRTITWPPGAPGTLAVIGFELPPELDWPPPGLPAASGPAPRIAGGAREREQALGRLMAARPASLLLVCHAPSSPDRGTARFLREAAFQAGRSALLLIAAQSGEGAPVPEAAARRWRDWLQAEDLPGVALLDSVAAADDWVASLDV